MNTIHTVQLSFARAQVDPFDTSLKLSEAERHSYAAGRTLMLIQVRMKQKTPQTTAKKYQKVGV